MTPHQTVAVGARLFGVWLLLNALNTGYFALIELGKNASASTLALGIFLTAIWALAGLALWSFPQVIARNLLPNPMGNEVPSAAGIAPDTWLVVGCVLIGIWVIVSALPSLAQDIAVTWPSVHLASSGVYFGVRVLLGAWLILGARGLRKPVRRTLEC
jgi:hypothetical protein